MKQKIALLTCVALSFCTYASPSHAEADKQFKGVRGQMVVHADAAHVWHAIRALRDDDPESVKMISQAPGEDVLEETFEDLPIIGKATCRYKETYKPYERIEYRMIQSDHFKAFEGSWVLTPMGNGEQTQVELSSYIDTGLVLPFAHQLTNMSTLRNVHKRLDEVKKAVESTSAGKPKGRSL